MEEGKGLPAREAEPQKGAKEARTAQTRSSSEGSVVKRGHDHCTKVQAWNPTLVLNRSSLPMDSSIRDF